MNSLFTEAAEAVGVPPTRVELRTRAVRSGVLQLTGQAVRLLLFLVSGMILARLLTPRDFGLVAMVTSVTAFVDSFRGFGLQMATVHRDRVNQREVSALFWISLVINFGTVILLALMAPAIAWFYGDARLIALTLVISGGIFALGLSAQPESLLMRQLRYERLTIIDVGSLLLGVGVGIASAWLGWGYWALAYQVVVTNVIRTAGIWLACEWRPTAPFVLKASLETTRPLVAYGAHLTGVQILTYLGRNLDRVLVGYFSGPMAAGLYDNAYRWSLYPVLQVYTPLTGIAVASLSRVQNDPPSLRRYYRAGVLPVFALAFPALTFMVLQPALTLRVLLGDQWIPAAPIFRLLCLAGIASSIMKVTHWLYLSHGETHRQLRWSFVYAPVMVLAVCLGAFWGPVGIASGFTVATWLLIYPAVTFCIRNSPLSPREFFGAATRPALASVAAALGILLVAPIWPGPHRPLVEMSWKLLLFGGIYLTAWTVSPGGRQASKDVLGLLKHTRSTSANG